jgi:hypothetical protein
MGEAFRIFIGLGCKRAAILSHKGGTLLDNVALISFVPLLAVPINYFGI